MKVLTEEEQLKKQYEDVWASHNYANNELSILERQLNNAGIFTSEGNKRVMKYEIGQQKKIVSFLCQYHTSLYDRWQELKNQRELQKKTDE